MEESEESRRNRLASLPDRLSRGMDRRDFVRTIVNAGYAVGLAWVLGVEDFLAADDGHVPVVTALTRAPGDDLETIEEHKTTVPAEWYAATTTAFEIHDLIDGSALPGFLGSAVLPGGYGEGTATVSVRVNPEDLDQASETVDELLSNVALDAVDLSVEGIEDIEGEGELEEVGGDPHLAEDVSDGLVPGGVTCENERTEATLAPALYRPDDDRAYFATAGHAFQPFDDPVGRRVVLPLETGDTVDLGRVRHEHPVVDVAVIEPTGGYRPDARIQGAQPDRVAGQLTRMGLADLAARGEELEKIGSRTGHSSGPIKGIDAVTCFTTDECRPGQLLWGQEEGFTDGDSGCVSYYTGDRTPGDGALIASFNNARTWWPGQSYVWGVAAYHLTEEYGYHF